MTKRDRPIIHTQPSPGKFVKSSTKIGHELTENELAIVAGGGSRKAGSTTASSGMMFLRFDLKM